MYAATLCMAVSFSKCFDLVFPGLIMATIFFDQDSHIMWSDCGDLILLYLALHAVRALNVVVCWPVLRRGYGLTKSEGFVLVYGGLRGAVGLCLALLLKADQGLMGQRNKHIHERARTVRK